MSIKFDNNKLIGRKALIFFPIYDSFQQQEKHCFLWLIHGDFPQSDQTVFSMDLQMNSNDEEILINMHANKK